MDDTSAKTLRHLAACASVLPPNLIQCQMGVNYAAREIQEGAKLKMNQSEGDLCQFCFTQIDVTKAKIEIEGKKKRKRLGKCVTGEEIKSKLQVTCHFCKKVCVAKSLPLNKKVTPIRDKVQEISATEDTEPSKKKKKRKKKDPNAGLIIPGKSVPVKAMPVEKPLVSISKEKLKHLINLNNSGRKGGLQDFLKRQ